MDVDAQYPHLSSLAQSHRRTLKNIGENAIPRHGAYLGLGECCYEVLNDYPRWANCNAYNYLHTLNEFVSRIPAKRRKIWKEITGKESAFLDTVVEAAWALHFWDNGCTANVYERFDPSNPKSKDADVVVILDGKKYWLDATSIKLNESDFPPEPALEGSFGIIDRLPDRVVDKVEEKAREKYQSKFGAAVRSGLFQGETLGVLLCVLKSEKQVDFLLDHDLKIPPPQGLLDNERPGLNLVWVHTLRASSDSDVLRPLTIAKWQTM